MVALPLNKTKLMSIHIVNVIPKLLYWEMAQITESFVDFYKSIVVITGYIELVYHIHGFYNYT